MKVAAGLSLCLNDRSTQTLACDWLTETVEASFLLYREQIFRYLILSGANASLAEEVTQDTFVRLYSHLAKGNRVENVRSWTFRVARNLMIDLQRTNHRLCQESSEKWLGWADTLADENPSPHELLVEKERTLDLERAIVSAGLTRLQQEALTLRMQGLRYRDIGEVLGLRVSTIEDCIRRAVQKVGQALRSETIRK
jgi:RNA polymerase sigma-70 factor, ECF subfamily